MDIRRGLTIGTLLTLTVAVVGCTAEATDEASPSPTVIDTMPTVLPADADEALLPMPSDEIATWAQTAVPEPGLEGNSGAFSGWLSQNTSAHYNAILQSQPAGVYTGQIACRGDGTLTLVAGDQDEQPLTEPVTCTNETIAFDVTTSEVGMTFTLDLEGAPTIYAVSFTQAG